MVLFGARAFAIPLRFGQSLDVYEVPGNAVLHWETTIQDRFWFTMEMHIDTFKVKYTSDAIYFLAFVSYFTHNYAAAEPQPPNRAIRLSDYLTPQTFGGAIQYQQSVFLAQGKRHRW